MIILSIKSDVDRLTRDLTLFERRQIPFAIVHALTITGQGVQAAEKAKMKAVFDRPTNFTLNSLFLRPATKARPEAEVYFKDFAPKGTPAGRYLAPEIEGGPRRTKPFENLLGIGGTLFKPGTYLVPTSALPRDGYGNVSSGWYNKILSALQARRDAYQNSRVSGKLGRRPREGSGPTYFAKDFDDGLPAGIWLRDGKSLTQLFSATRRPPRYRARFPFYEVAEDTIPLRFPSAFEAALKEAIRTARP